LLVKQVTNSANHEHFVVLVIPAIAAAFDRPKLCELLLPVSKYMRLNATKFAHFTNGEVAFGWDRWEGVLHWNHKLARGTYKLTLSGGPA
jgi:hypothetical protein